VIATRKAWLLAGAGVLAFFAQRSLDQGQGWRGLVLYAIVAALFAAGAAPAQRSQQHTRSTGFAAWPADPRQSLVASGLLTGIVLFIVDTADVSSAVWLLQAGAIGLVVFAAHLADKGNRSELSPPRSPIELNTATTQVILVVIVAGGAWLRFRDLASVPYGFWFDEADVGLLARRIADEGYRPVFAGNVPAYDAYLIALLSGIFGDGMATVRAVSAIFGTATILAGYFVGRELFGKMGGLILAFLIAFSRWSITLSRIGMNNVTLPLFALLTLGFLVRGHRRQSNTDFALAGLAAGAGMLFYSALASSLVAFGVFALYLALTTKQHRRSLGPQVLVAAVAAFAVTAPLAKFIVQDTDRYFGRNRNTALWSDAGQLDNDGVIDALRTTLRRYLPMTHYQGDRNGRHNIPREPMTPPLVAGLSVGGAGLLLVRKDRWLTALVLAWFPLAYAPGVLSLPWEAPNSLRAVGIQPLIFVVATAAIIAVARTIVSSKRSKQAMLGVLAAALAVTGYTDANAYFDSNRNLGEVWAIHSTPETIAARLTAAAPGNTYVQAVSFLRDTPTQRYLTPNSSVDVVFDSETPLPLYVPAGQDTLIFGMRESFNIAAQAQAFYPNAVIRREFQGLESDLVALEIPAQDIADSLGWTASAPDGRANYRAALVLDQSGPYQFRLAGDDQRQLVVDGVSIQPCDANQTIPLASGLHQIDVLSAEATAPTPALEWRPPGVEQWAPIPPDRLVQGSYLPGGLVATHYEGHDDRDTPAFFEVDASSYIRLHEFVIPRPYQVQWTGGLQVPATGDYEFSLITDDEVELVIGGQTILTNGTEFSRQSVIVSLEEGLTDFSMLYKDQDGRSEIFLQWRPPGSPGPVVPIPQDLLVPWLEPTRLSRC